MKRSSHASQIFSGLISLTAPFLLLNFVRGCHVVQVEMRRFLFSPGPSLLAAIVLVDFACMTLLVLLSL